MPGYAQNAGFCIIYPESFWGPSATHRITDQKKQLANRRAHLASRAGYSYFSSVGGWHLCYYAAYFDIKKKSHINLVLRNLSWKMIFGWPTFKILCDTTILYKLLKVKLKTKKAIMRNLNQLKVHFWLFFFHQYLYEIPSCG